MKFGNVDWNNAEIFYDYSDLINEERKYMNEEKAKSIMELINQKHIND